jgi:hypothetical protein
MCADYVSKSSLWASSTIGDAIHKHSHDSTYPTPGPSLSSLLCYTQHDMSQIKCAMLKEMKSLSAMNDSMTERREGNDMDVDEDPTSVVFASFRNFRTCSCSEWDGDVLELCKSYIDEVAKDWGTSIDDLKKHTSLFPTVSTMYPISIDSGNSYMYTHTYIYIYIFIIFTSDQTLRPSFPT